MKITLTLVFGQAILITIISAAIGVSTNAVRPKGIPLITDIPYEIFAPCRDSEATSEAYDLWETTPENNEIILYIDARPKEEYVSSHVKDALNVPYTALFGATDDDVAKVLTAAKALGATTVVVYGKYEDPEAPGQFVDFSKPLAQQLAESGLKNTRHIKNGLETLKKSGLTIVEQNGEKQ